jgi:hypothetical protein
MGRRVSLSALGQNAIENFRSYASTRRDINIRLRKDIKGCVPSPRTFIPLISTTTTRTALLSRFQQFQQVQSRNQLADTGRQPANTLFAAVAVHKCLDGFVRELNVLRR